MLQTLRAPLIAGTVAAFSAAAVAVPTGQMAALSAPSAWSADVALKALANPIAELLATAEVAQNYVFATYYNGADAPTPGAGEANWPFAGFDQTGGDVLNYLLYREIPLGYYNAVGTLPNNARNASPVLQQLQVNLFDYINVGLSGVNAAVVALAQGVWDYPAALITAGQLALQGQFLDAIGVLTDAVVGPITEAGASLLAAGGYILNDFVAKAVAVVSAIPQIVTVFAGATIGSAAEVAAKSAAIFTEWVGKLAQFDLEGAWNVGVAGLLGPSGLPGTLLNLTTGAGVQTGPIVNPETDITGNFVPSFRTAIQSAVWTVAEALTATPAPVAATPAVAAAATPSASTARASQTPAAQTPAVESGAEAAADTPAADAASGDSPGAVAPTASLSAGRSAGAAGKAAANRGSADRDQASRGAAGRNGE